MSEALAPHYRMPIAFGPAPGPRNLPSDKAHLRYRKSSTSLSVSARTDAGLLARLLPEGFELAGEPRIDVSIIMLRDIGWLAGRGYNILVVRIPAMWRGVEHSSGDFVPVVWENMADPIITGREELGWCKIYAEIDDLAPADGHCRARASWDGHVFFRIEATGLIAADPAPSPSGPMMFAKYIPRTGHWGQAEVRYTTCTAPDGPPPEIDAIEQGAGHFAFDPARWEEMPTQYPIVNALAALPLSDFSPAVLVRSTGGGDGSGQRILA